MDYLTTTEISKNWGISQRRVAILCEQKRINGIKKVGKSWMIPSNAVKPDDGRIEAKSQNKKISMEFGKYYNSKLEKYSYSPDLQKCIKEAYQYCVKTLDENPGKPLLLFGKIQSGKTRAFTGLMALAFDNEFDMVIILTKNSTALVEQTYKRMRKEFHNEIYNNEVKLIEVKKGLDDEVKLTDYELDKKLIFILKKERRNLEKLNKFITEYTLNKRKNCLIIDDEADSAGIGYGKAENTTDEFYQRKVASEVNDLRGTLKGCAYVQVTATPYALCLQSEIQGESIEPTKPYHTILVPSGDGYIGGDYYFLESQKDNHPARLIFEPVSEEENELVSNQKRKNKKSKIEDRRTFKIENIITDQDHLYVYKKGIMNFIVGGCVLRMSNNNTHYSYVIHTATQKSSHFSLEAITEEFINQIKNSNSCQRVRVVVEKLLHESYEDIKQSYTEYGYMMPSFETVSDAFNHAIRKDYISVAVVNSDRKMNAILDEDSGELHLRSPFSIIVGGQVLDRGVTIPRMIGFYYGRNPKKAQQDTVMQHSRMFGYRDKDLLSVTRFYTTKRIFQNMTYMTESDNDLRKNIEIMRGDALVYFLKKCKDDIVPCADHKILPSIIVTLTPLSRILPVGFSPVSKSHANKISADIAKHLSVLKSNLQPCSKVVRINVKDLVPIIKLVYSILREDDESFNKFIPQDYFLEILKNLAQKKNGEVLLYTRSGGQISKYKSNGMIYQDAPDTGYELKDLRQLATDTPVLMLIHQNGTAEGWNGSEFWWPVIIVPANITASKHASPKPKGKITKK